jgi:hypothetical protein
MVGVDGSEFPFVTIGEESFETPLRLAKDPGGLGGAPGRHDDDQNVDQAGVTWRARMFEPNVLTLPIRFGPLDAGEAALDRYCEYRDAMGDGRQVGEFHVTSVRRGIRRDRFQYWRLPDGALPEANYSAAVNVGFVDEGDVQLRSDESWWRQVPVEKTWTPAQFAGASVPNVCDDDVWPYFEITGPITNPTFGVAGESITILTTISAGQVWKINTDPNRFQILNAAGVDVSWVRAYWRKRAPRRTAASLNNGTSDVPVTLGGSGTSAATRVKIVLPQVFRSAL